VEIPIIISFVLGYFYVGPCVGVLLLLDVPFLHRYAYVACRMNTPGPLLIKKAHGLEALEAQKIEDVRIRKL
jgi:hypothetical protein